MSDNTAILAGFTREVMVSGLELEAHCFIPPQADVGEVFAAYNADDCHFTKYAEWLVTVQDIV